MTEISITLPNDDTIEFEVEEDYITRGNDSDFTHDDAILDYAQAHSLVANWRRSFRQAHKEEGGSGQCITREVGNGSEENNIFVIVTRAPETGLLAESWSVGLSDDDDEYRLSNFPMKFEWKIVGPTHEEAMQEFHYDNSNNQLFAASLKIITADLNTVNCLTFEGRIQPQAQTHIAFLKEFDIEIPEGYATWLYTELRRAATEAIQIEANK